MAGFDSSYKACLSQAHLVCALCDGPLRKPVILPCFHAFCGSCLKTDQAERRNEELPSCPTCQTKLETEDMKNLPVVHFLQTLQDVIKSSRFERRSCVTCNRDKYAVWMCKTCEENLCGVCKETHSENRGKESHTDFEFLDSTVKEICQRRNDFYCDDHPEEILAYYCDTCSKSICVVCESTRHETHTTERLSTKADAMRRDLSKVFSDFMQDFKKLKAADDKRSVSKTKHRSRIEKEINDWAKILKKQIDQKAKDLLEEMFNNKGKGHLNGRSGVLGDKIWDAVSYFPKQLSDYGSDVEVINLADAVTNKLKDLRQKDNSDDFKIDNIQFIPEIKATPGEIISIGKTKGGKSSFELKQDHAASSSESDTPDLKSRNGEDLSSPPPRRHYPRVDQVTSFQAEWDVTGISVTSDNEYLITSRLRKALLVYEPSGNLVREVTQRGQNPFDATVLKNGNYVITDREAKKVNVFLPEGNFLETLKIEIGEPGGIAALSNGDLVICDLKQKDVCIFSPHRKMFPLRSLKTENGNQTFKWPLYIAVNSSDEIIVSDNELHSVKIFDRRGKMRAQYGNYGDYGEKLRGPRGICTDSSDNIFVTDYTNDRIHMLDANGKFLRILMGREEGLSGPRVVAMDTNNRLVIGQENATIKIIDFKN